MNITASILKNGLMALFLSLLLLGCAQTQTFVKESGASYKQDEKNAWVNEPSAEATNWTTYSDMQGD
jgi:hypothetical protein